MAYAKETRERALALVRSGLTAKAAAAAVGAVTSTVTRWCARDGMRLARGWRGQRRGEADALAVLAGDRPTRTSPRSRLALADRAAIQEGVRAGRSLRSIAADLGFSHTTVSREVRRASQDCVSSREFEQKEHRKLSSLSIGGAHAF